MNATVHWPTAHGPDCLSAMHAGHSLLRRGPVPKLVWADLFVCVSKQRA